MILRLLAILLVLGITSRLLAEETPAALLELRARQNNAPQEERPLWGGLLGLAERCLAAKLGEEDWKTLARSAGKPVLVTSERPVAARVLAGLSETVLPFEAGYRVWLVPTRGAAYLVAVPEDGLLGATNLLDRLQSKLAAGAEVARVEAEKKRLRELILKGARNEAWFVSIVRLYPAPGLPFGGDPVQVGVREGNLVVTPQGGRAVRMPVPDGEQVGRWIGRPFAPPPNAAGVPAGAKIYVALDWSKYLGSTERRAWLLGELQHALRGLDEKAFVDESVFLHSGKAVAAWPVADLRQGKLPDSVVRGVPGHALQTLETLAEVVTQAEAQKTGVSRVYFLTWNPSATIPVDLRERDLKSAAPFDGLEARIAKLPIAVVQMGEARLPCLASLARRRYFTVPFGSTTEPNLSLPNLDD